MFDKIWHDPVWSKVIGALIMSIITLISSFFVAKIKGRQFKQVFIEFWTIKTEIWIFAVCLILIYTLNYTVLGTWAYLIGFLMMVGYQGLFSKGTSSKTTQSSNILFKSKGADDSYFLGIKENNWKDNRRVGDIAKGEFSLNNGVLNIERDNVEGIFLIKLQLYFEGKKTVPFIKKDISKSVRIISVIFQAKIIGGTHTINVIAKKYGKTDWVHDANKKFKISNKDWIAFKAVWRIPSNQDFVVDLHDIDVDRVPSSVQIRDLTIVELLN